LTAWRGPALAWLRDHEPATYGDASWALQPKDWLRARLTGRVAGDHSDASATLLYDVAAGGWAFDVVEALRLRTDLLPPLLESTAVAGLLSPAAADELGLRAGIAVAAGAADTAAAALGTRLVEPGPVQMTVGTGGQVLTVLARPNAGRAPAHAPVPCGGAGPVVRDGGQQERRSGARVGASGLRRDVGRLV